MMSKYSKNTCSRHRELTNRPLLLEDAVGSRDMPTTHAHKELSSVAPKSLVTAICRRLETVGRDDFSRYLWNFWRLNVYELARNEIFLRHWSSGDWN